jgi:NSS family neurotransmitter:Na+ symporter
MPVTPPPRAAAAPRPAKVVHGLWSSPAIFVLAAVGYTIGLNSIWQFPYHAAHFGGGAFVFFYLLFVGLFGLPLLMAQTMLGRLARLSPPSGMAALVRRAHAPRHWKWLGGLAVAAGFLVLAYYGVVGGWLVAYLLRAASGALHGLTSDGAGVQFNALVADPEKQLFWHSLFLAATMLVVARGVRNGLEPVARVAVPALLGLLLVQAGYSAATGAFLRTASALFAPDFTHITSEAVLTALGDAFYSVGFGTAVMFMYGAYLPAEASIARTTAMVTLVNTGAALLGALVVLPLLYDSGSDLVGGVELVFQVVAVSFDSLPFGAVMRTTLFVLLLLVAWLSCIALVEPAVAWLVERRGIGRWRAAFYCGALLWALGVAMILSLNYWKFTFSLLGVVKTLGLFDIVVILTSNILLPVTSLACAVFAGWVLSMHMTREAMALRSPCTYDIWLWTLRLGVPAALLVVLLNTRLFL